jgi:hypothetical protein
MTTLSVPLRRNVQTASCAENKGERMITYESVKAALGSIVDEVGEDYINSGGCLYKNHDGKPVCIVGKYLMEYCNVPSTFFDGTLHSIERTRALNSSRFDFIQGVLNSTFGLKWSPQAVRYLSRVQTVQDLGYPWGKAVEDSRRLIEEGPNFDL